ncbi:ATP-binding protein [Streptomyces sp. NBC_00193]|uniref:ATP-binding protein n=1 Tax=unclassified Streptomyces TaxID=2593676 RepID=UPI002255FDF5|nr:MULTISPECIES: ATP-binding protein [unclassified Streptomyces]MCX5129977.1 ATP-binding protein [Streptomyces sp. NBC_00347]MCX5300347.1 ATP-binding protein [Streptomyces sp. NBC_00193]
MSDNDNPYDASRIQVLEGLEAVRKRPGMYVGSTSRRGLHQIVFDVAERAVNEVLAGRASTIEVTLTSDGGVSVADDGPGVPVEAAGDTGGPGLEALLTRMHPGVAEPGGRHAVAMSLFGIGPCVTNALSSRLTAEVRRDGVRWVHEYARGVALAPPTSAGPTSRSGTTIAFWPDTDIFETTECSFAVLAERFRELAFLNRGLDIALTDERPPGRSRSVRFRFPGGARDFVAFLDAQGGASVHPDIIGFEREDPRIAGTVEVALRWRGSPEERLQGYVNSEPTPHGGTHMAGFRDGTAAAVNTHVRERRLLAEAASDLSIDQIGDGLTAVVSVKLDRPEFSGSTRGVLDGAAVRTSVADAVREHLGTWLEQHPEQAAAIVGRIVQGARQD